MRVTTASLLALPLMTACLLSGHPALAAGEKLPFPQARQFSGMQLPSNVSRDQMNSSVDAYYHYWKDTYLKPSNGVTPGGGYYVAMKGTGGNGREKTTSEAHGYGMIILALMAGKDARAQSLFDGMYNLYDKHRSRINRQLMSWVIDESESTAKDSDSATDGDMDIAYALLLAHYQWGSGGKIDYITQARRIINKGIKVSEIGRSSRRTLLGDWSSDPYATRPSDWMTGHMRAYAEATGDAAWNDITATTLDMVEGLAREHAPTTGLMPDFVVGSTPRPAAPNFLEAETDDDFSWNACRFPFRMALDAAHSGDRRARDAVNRIASWITTTTNNDPRGIMAGYTLKGKPLVGYSDMAFTAPMVAAATMASGDHQAFINRGWALMTGARDGYYPDTINLMSMLFVSGNWWAPTAAGIKAGGGTGGTGSGGGGSGSGSGSGSGGGSEPAPNTVTVGGVTVSASEDGGIGNVMDGSLKDESRWSVKGDGAWLLFDFGEPKPLDKVMIAFYRGNERQARFELQTGNSRYALETVLSARSSGTAAGFESFDLQDRKTRYVRFVGHNNTENDWNSLREVKFVFAGDGGSGGTTTGGDSGGGSSANTGGHRDDLCKDMRRAPTAGEWQSPLARFENGRLDYATDRRSNRIPDYSHAGYRAGEQALPDVDVVKTLGPIAGDNTARLQAALDDIGRRPANSRGHRGTLLLQPGHYEIHGILKIRSSGVVLRGSGSGGNAAEDTILLGIGNSPKQRTLVVVGSGNDDPWASTTRARITDDSVAVGSRSFRVDNASAFSAGDRIMITHPSTQAWINAVDGGGVVDEPRWRAGRVDIPYLRRITRVDGNVLHIDAPVFNTLDRSLAQSVVGQLTASDTIRESGIERLRVDIQSRGGNDENHAWRGIGVIGAENAWVSGVTVRGFGHAGIYTSGAIHITIEKSHALDPVAKREGGRMYNFDAERNSQLILFSQCSASHGRHHFISNGAQEASGIVFHRCRSSEDSGSSSEGHRLWSTGLLFDAIDATGGNIQLINRGDYGSGHGWASAHSTVWNFNSVMLIQQPPTAQNYAVSSRGSLGSRFPWRGAEGRTDFRPGKLFPESLYEAQLCSRLNPR
jgi:endo-1,4-beta-D-glucanase Y